MQTLDYAFIGAGLANLAGARIISEADKYRIAIFDSGKGITERFCPGVRPQKCVFCSPGCAIISGEGGTNALFGNKFCYFPASSRILDSFSSPSLASAWGWLDETLSDWFNSSNNRGADGYNPLGLKHYEAEVFSPLEFQKMVSSLADPLISRDMLRLRSEVVAVERNGRQFRIRLRAGDVYNAHVVVLGTGRSGSSLIRQTCSNLGIPVFENQPDVGVRIEAPSGLFSDFYNYQEDPKLKRNFPEGSVRTFCAENGGIIVPVPLGRGFFAEGAYPIEARQTNNIALMVRSKAAISETELQEWCVKINRDQNGNLLTAELPITRTTPATLINRIASVVPALPTVQHDNLMAALLEMLSSAMTPLFRDVRGSAVVRVYAPAVDNYWPVPEIHAGLQTRRRGFFITGDAAGLSRGYVQALTSGAAWAFSHLADDGTPNSRAVSRCLVSA